MEKLSFKKSIYLITYSIILLVVLFNFNVVVTGFNTLLGILSPFFIGLTIAFIVNLPLKKIEPLLSNKLKMNHKRVISIILSFSLIALFFGSILFFLIPQVMQSMATLSSQFDSYILNFDKLVMDMATTFNIPLDFWNELLVEFNSFISDFINVLLSLFPHLFDATIGFANGAVNVFLGFVLSFYLLSSKEILIKDSNRLLTCILPQSKYDYFQHVCSLSNKIFSSFISGQLLEAFILGALCTLGLLILQIEYAVLIGVIIGFCSLIPIFGAIFGTIPCFFILFVISPQQSFMFLIFIFVLQQIEGDFIYPKVVGNSIGLSGLWVMLSMIVGSSLLGVLGLIVGIPTFAVFYALLHEWVDKTLKLKNKKQSQ